MSPALALLGLGLTALPVGLGWMVLARLMRRARDRRRAEVDARQAAWCEANLSPPPEPWS